MASRTIPADGGVGEVVEQLSQMLDAGRKDDALAAVRMMLEAVVRENEQQRQKIAELLRRVYGPSGEKLDPRQLRLALEEMRAEAQAQQPAVDPEAKLPNEPAEPTRERNAKERRHGRRKLPADLPRQEIRLFPTVEQVADKGTMSKVDEERSEVLEYEPATFKVLVYIREIWSNAEGQIVTAPVPNKVIAKGLPGPGLLTQITLSKYEYHCPLNRQTRMYARSGVELHRNTLVDWIAAVAFLLEPVARRIHQRAMLCHVLQVDDTTLKVLDQDKASNIKRGHLWVMVGDAKYVSFRYTENWTAKKAKEFLGERIGWMQIDGYKGYESIVEDGLALPVGCWMHCRRYFYKAFEAKDLRAAVPLEIIGKLYEVERKSKEAGDDHEQRRERRLEKSVPILDELEEWIRERHGLEPTSTLLGKALTYAHNHWKILRVVVQDGALELDNGEVERVIRGPAMGRRNWLFAGSDEGAERAAVILTVLETAKRAGIDRRAYLHDLLVKLSDGWLMSRLDELLPENWTPGLA
jgi:transposase